MSSSVAAPESSRSGSARVAESRSSKTATVVVANFEIGTVRKTASATKARVPSEPMSRCSKSLTGSSKSRKEFRP